VRFCDGFAEVIDGLGFAGWDVLDSFGDIEGTGDIKGLGGHALGFFLFEHMERALGFGFEFCDVDFHLIIVVQAGTPSLVMSTGRRW